MEALEVATGAVGAGAVGVEVLTAVGLKKVGEMEAVTS